MNNKVVIGILATIVVVGIGIYYSLPPASPVPTIGTATNTTASTAPQTVSSQKAVKTNAKPPFTIGTTTVVQSFARFDQDSLTSTSTYPVITGTANVPKIGLTIYNSDGNGIVRPNYVPVIQGHWSYYDSVALMPGTYILILVVGNVDVTAKLVVKNP